MKQISALSIAVLMAMSMCLVAFKTANAQITVMSLQPGTISGPPPDIGDAFGVTLEIADVTNLWGWAARLAWNHAILEMVGTPTEGPFLQPGTLFTAAPPDNVSGILPDMACGRDTATGVNGSGILAYMTFRVKAYGSATISITYSELWDPADPHNPIAHGKTNSTINLSHPPDVAVTNITTCKDGCAPLPSVGQNYYLHINVTVENQGDYPENFNVTVYANSTAINQTQLQLPSKASTVLVIRWNATLSYGNYTISAVADVVENETDTEDNTYLGSIVLVTIPGDITADFKVNYKDLGRVIGNAYGKTAISSYYDPNTDLNDSHKTDYIDLGILLAHYGQHYP